MIERVAKAIDEHTKQNKITSSVALARVVIQAMHKPTDEQRNNYYSLKKKNITATEIKLNPHWDLYMEFSDVEWKLMIEAALGEHVERD